MTDIKRLQAAELHEESADTPETPAIKRVDYPNYTELSIGDIEICVFWWGLRPGGHHPTTAMFDDVSCFKTAQDFEAAHALLQEAQRLMRERDG